MAELLDWLLYEIVGVGELDCPNCIVQKKRKYGMLAQPR